MNKPQNAPKGAQILLKLLPLLIAALVFAPSTICGHPSLLNVALAAALPPYCVGAVLAGTIFAGFFSRDIDLTVTIFALIIMCLVNVFKPKKRHDSTFSALLAVGCALAAATILNLIFRTSAELIALDVFYSVICGASAFAVATALAGVRALESIPISGRFGTAVCVCLALLVTALSASAFYPLNSGRILAVFASLCAARLFGGTRAGICAAAVIFGMALSSPTLAQSACLLGFAAATASAFKQLPRSLFALTFFAFCSASLLVLGMNELTLSFLYDCAAASAISLFVAPESLKRFLTSPDSGELSGSPFSAVRLQFTAGMLSDIRRSSEAVSLALERREEGSNDVVGSMIDEICRDCRNFKQCFSTHRSEAELAFQSFSDNRSLSDSQLPAFFESCLCRKRLLSLFEHKSVVNRAYSADCSRIRETRNLLYSMIETQSMLFADVGRAEAAQTHASQALSSRAEDCLVCNGAVRQSARVYMKNGDFWRLEAYFDNTRGLSFDELRTELESALDIDVECGELNSSEQLSKLTLFAYARYSIEVGLAGSSAEDGVCGDSLADFMCSDGSRVLAISDGMGRGRAAAISSRLCLSLLKKLCAGATGRVPLENPAFINALLRVKSCAESFASLDCACIDRYTGEAMLVKSGAAATLVKSGDRVLCIKAASFPLGIVSPAEPYTKSISLAAGDAVVLLSDGVDERYYSMIKTLLLSDELDSQALATRIIELSGGDDDASAVVCRLSER